MKEAKREKGIGGLKPDPGEPKTKMGGPEREKGAGLARGLGGKKTNEGKWGEKSPNEI